MELVRSKNSGFSKSENVKVFGLPGTHKISLLIQQILTENVPGSVLKLKYESSQEWFLPNRTYIRRGSHIRHTVM